MPIFFVGALWVLAVGFGLLCLLLNPLRHLGMHLILGSTLGFVSSFILSIGIVLLFFVIPEPVRVDFGHDFPVIAGLGLLGGYLVAMFVGGFLGTLAGSRIALWINVQLGWQRADRWGDVLGILTSSVRWSLRKADR
jgi:hypothetical protein